MAATRHLALVLGGPGAFPAMALHAWLDAGHRVAGFLHAETGRAWREGRLLAWLRPRPSETAALRRARLRPEAVPPRGLAGAPLAELERTGAAVLLSVGVRRRVPAAVLERLPGRAVNMHPALLPAYRGPSPTRALLRDDAVATAGGATLHVMDAGFDTGPVIARRGVAPPPPRDALGYTSRPAPPRPRWRRSRCRSSATTAGMPARSRTPGGRQPMSPSPTSHSGPDWDRARIERLAAAPPGPIGTVQAPWAGGVVRVRRLRGPERRLWHVRRLIRMVTEPIPPPGPEVP